MHYDENRGHRRFDRFHWFSSAVHGVDCECAAIGSVVGSDGLGYPCYELTAQHQDAWRKAYAVRARRDRRSGARNLKTVPMHARLPWGPVVPDHQVLTPAAYLTPEP